jgi:hypothetical protein
MDRTRTRNWKPPEPYYDLDAGGTTYMRSRKLRTFFGCATIEGIMVRNCEGLHHDTPARIKPPKPTSSKRVEREEIRARTNRRHRNRTRSRPRD